MRTLIATLATLAASVAAGSDSRTLLVAYPSAGVAIVDIDTAVGNVEIRGAEVDAISARVTLRTTKRGLASSRRAARRLEAFDLVPELTGSTLRLRLRPPLRKGECEASWSVLIPAAARVRLDAGVGDVRISDVKGGVNLDLGVGDVRLLDVDGEITVDLGVGDVEARGEWAAFGPIDATCGVGGAVLRTPDGRYAGRGLLGRRIEARGPGAARLNVDVGVGDVTIVLR